MISLNSLRRRTERLALGQNIRFARKGSIVSIEEKDPLQLIAGKRTEQEATFISTVHQGPERELARPFGIPDWKKLGILLLSSITPILFFTHNINLDKLILNWKISFDVNLVTSLIIIVLGVVAIVPKALKNPMLWLSQKTITSLVVLLLLAAFFLFKVLNLGTFSYSLDKLDLSSGIGLLCLGPVVFLAFRKSVAAVAVLVAFFLWWGFSIRGFGTETVVDLFTSENGARLLRNLTPPRWEYFTRVIDPMLLTVQTAITSTVIGVIIALPLSILAARNTTPHPVIYNVVRFLINTIRAVPALIWALLLIPFVGLGPGAGILGLGLHSVSVLTKLFAESFESVKPQPLEALNAVGANGLKTFRWGVFPQAFPLVASYSIFNWESNGRDSTVVAFVGGGGVGFLLQQNLSVLDYTNVAVLLIVLIITVAIMDRFSDFIRSRII